MTDFTIPPSAKNPVRYGMTLRVRPERFEEYRKAHAAVWPEVLATITRCSIRNYSIYHRDFVLFSYFEYWGDDFAYKMGTRTNMFQSFRMFNNIQDSQRYRMNFDLGAR